MCVYIYTHTYVEAGIIRTFKNRVLGVSYRLDLHHKGANARKCSKTCSAKPAIPESSMPKSSTAVAQNGPK